MESNLNQEILNELIQIRRLLTIFSQDKLEEFQANIEKKYLTTDQRHKMYELFDGENSYKAIADAVSSTSEGVRKFAITLEQAGLIEYIQTGKTRNPKRLF